MPQPAYPEACPSGRRAQSTQRMIINKAEETEQNNNPYKDTLLSYKIESMEREYNEQFQQICRV